MIRQLNSAKLLPTGVRATLATCLWLLLWNLLPGQDAEYHYLRFVDGRDSFPISYVHLYADDKIIAMSDRVGECILDMAAIQGERLRGTCIGYRSVDITYDSALVTTIYMRPLSYTLSTVVVSAKDDSSKIILQKVKQHFAKNYSKSKYYLEFFHRETAWGTTMDEFSHLAEAVGTIQLAKSRTNPERSKIYLNQFRCSYDLADYHHDPRLHNWMKSNGILYNLVDDPIRSYGYKNYEDEHPKEKLLDDILNDSAQTTYFGTLQQDECNLFVIHYARSFWNGELYVDSEDFAIVKMTRTFSLSNSIKTQGTPERQEEFRKKLKKWEAKSTFEYQKIGQYYFPLVLHGIRLNSIRNGHGLFEKYEGGMQEDLTLVTGITRQKPSGLGKHKRIKKEERLVDITMPYDSSYWAKNVFLADHPLNEKVLGDLRLGGPIEKQFRRGNVK